MIIVARKLPPDAHIIDLTEQPPLEPARVPLLVGEVLQDLRSSLDHLVGQLEQANGLRRDSGFEYPIFWDRARFVKKVSTKILGVSAAAVAVIERSQPYHRPAPAYKDHPLWILHDLNNADKHRVLIPTTSALTVDNLNINIAPGEVRETIVSIPAHHRAAPHRGPVPNNPAEGERWTLNATFTQFGQVANHPIIPGLEQLHDVVKQIIDACRLAV